jgi:hypothetical protein
LAIFREIHQVQGFIDFDRGKFGLDTMAYLLDMVALEAKQHVAEGRQLAALRGSRNIA